MAPLVNLHDRRSDEALVGSSRRFAEQAIFRVRENAAQRTGRRLVAEFMDVRDCYLSGSPGSFVAASFRALSSCVLTSAWIFLERSVCFEGCVASFNALPIALSIIAS
jgi:hypothetical protein